jgi:energy-coupling factor transporter ATP-binding protein EcfA2/energy-coupling factor transporter transmembrane protein EcfT
LSIQLNDITVYEDKNGGRRILDSINCTLAEDSITLIVGHTGAGKSTLLDVMAGLVPPDEGDIQYDRSPIWQEQSNGKKVKLKQGILQRNGVVFQFPEHQLFAKSVEAEFLYSLRPYSLTREDIATQSKHALRQFGLSDDLLSQSPFTLSTGQKRRVALATVFATKATWLFLDEPTSGLDPAAIDRLLHQLITWQQQTRGSLVIATHDLDTFLPIANQVVVLEQGRIVEVCTPDSLMERTEESLKSIGIPQQLKVQSALKKHGIAIPSGFLSAEEMAKTILDQIRKPSAQPIEGTPQTSGNTSSQIELEVFSTGMVSAGLDRKKSSSGKLKTKTGEPSAKKNPASIIRRLDPRSKWLFYVLVSVGVLLQHTWPGKVFAGLLTVLFIRLCGASIRHLWRVSKPFLGFVLLSAVISGLRFGGTRWISFSLTHAEVTIEHLYPFVLLMWLGMLLTYTTSQNAIKHGLEQTLSGLKWTKFPVEAFALATSLMFRFIPMIKRDVERFSKIMRARAKMNTKPGTIRYRDLHVVMIPLLISLIQLAESVSIAMEARGYKKTGQIRTSSLQLRFTRYDWCVLVVALLTLGLLLATRNLHITS